MKKVAFPRSSDGREIRALSQPGYYPRFSTLKQQNTWDDATRKIVVARVEKTPAIQFFSPQEAEILEAIIDRVTPQDDRAEEMSIPILPMIDERLFKNALNGFRYEDMPPDQEAYRRGLSAIDEMAQERFKLPFIELSIHQQELLLKSLHDAQPDPHNSVWDQMPVHRFWALLMDDCVTAYYSHPWAWDEIGFGGPAYPRGYMRLENGLPEPWETDERRYEWSAPTDSVSELDEENKPQEHSSTDGHGGSH